MSLEYGIDAQLYRPSTDFGDTTYPTNPTATIRCARSIRRPELVTDAGRQAFTQDGVLYVYRNADVADGDKVVLPEGEFIVRGVAENDQVHPMNGHDFGVKRFNIERG